MDLSFLDVGLRLGTPALAVAAIGINRDLADKPIGSYTLGLVALGAATVAVAWVETFSSKANGPPVPPPQ